MRILLANFTKMVNDSGGLAKVTCAFANEMIARGHEVSLIYSDESEGKFFFEISDKLKCYNLKLNTDGSRIKFPIYLKIVRELYRTFNDRKARTVNSCFDEKHLLKNLQHYLNIIQPEIIVSYQPAASKLLLCDLDTKIPVITMSHGDPEDYFHIYPVKEIPSLEKSAICQVLMPSFEQHIKNHLPKARTITIGNAIPQFTFSADLASEKVQYKIIFVGRLTKNHKRPHLLVEAFSKLSAKHPNWIVELWGMAERKTYLAELKSIIAANNLQEKVFIMGATPYSDVPLKLKEADIFAFPSAYEGFGMALAEGMSVGLPAVGYASCPAVNEIIEDGKTGFLVQDGVEPLAEALDKLMSDKALRIQMGQAAKESMAQYAPEKIWDAWEDLMRKIISEQV